MKAWVTRFYLTSGIIQANVDEPLSGNAILWNGPDNRRHIIQKQYWFHTAKEAVDDCLLRLNEIAEELHAKRRLILLTKLAYSKDGEKAIPAVLQKAVAK